MDKKVIPNEIIFNETERLLGEGMEVEFRPKGSSMLPFIRGDRDSVVLGRAEELSVGDIVLAKLDRRYVLHRIIAIEGAQLTLMGDGNIRGTESCTRAQVIGKVSAIVRENGRVRRPSDGRLWRKLLPVRRYILAIYRRICL